MKQEIKDTLTSIGFKEDEMGAFHVQVGALKITVCEHPLRGLAFILSGHGRLAGLYDEQFIHKTEISEISIRLKALEILDKYEPEPKKQG